MTDEKRFWEQLCDRIESAREGPTFTQDEVEAQLVPPSLPEPIASFLLEPRGRGNEAKVTEIKRRAK